MKRPPEKPAATWLRIATEARPQLSIAPAPTGAAPAWLVTRTLAAWRAARTVPAPWFALPGLARAATVSAVLAVACAVLVFSTVSVDDFTVPAMLELEELDLS